MGIGVIILVGIVVLAITALLAQLTKGRKDNPHQTTRRFFLAPPLMGTTNPRKSGFWYTTNWFAGEKVNEAISEGKARSTHKRRSHHAYSQQKRSRHGRSCLLWDCTPVSGIYLKQRKRKRDRCLPSRS